MSITVAYAEHLVTKDVPWDLHLTQVMAAGVDAPTGARQVSPLVQRMGAGVNV